MKHIFVNRRKSTPFANALVPVVTLVAIGVVLLANVSGAFAEPVEVAEPAKPPAAEVPANDAATGYLLSLTIDKAEVRPSQQIVVGITVTNGTKQTVRYVDEHFEKEFKMSVKDEKGTEVPLTSYGRLLFAADPAAKGFGGILSFDFNPGEKMEYRMLVNRIYDMTLAGTYTIVASRTFRIRGVLPPALMKDGGIKRTSNAVQVLTCIP